MTSTPGNGKGQCQFGEDSDVVPRCTAPATRKFGDHWFCEEHGKRGGVAPLVPDAGAADEEEDDTPSHPIIVVMDVESIGLYGEAFAVAAAVVASGRIIQEFGFACNPDKAKGREADRQWVRENVVIDDVSCMACMNPFEVRTRFWQAWMELKKRHPGVILAAECSYPVEAAFLTACIHDDLEARCWEGPYPLHDIATFMWAAGMDPLADRERLPAELPKHNPVADVRQSVRLFVESLKWFSEMVRNAECAPLPAGATVGQEFTTATITDGQIAEMLLGAVRRQVVASLRDEPGDIQLKPGGKHQTRLMRAAAESYMSGANQLANYMVRMDGAIKPQQLERALLLAGNKLGMGLSQPGPDPKPQSQPPAPPPADG